MIKSIIEDFIQIAEKREPDAHGSNKQCFFIDDYALLSQTFITEEIDRIMQICEELEKKGVNVARTLDYRIIEQMGQIKNGNFVKGYVLQQRAIGNPLLDGNNWAEEGKRFQIDYFKQIDSIAQEGQGFFNNFVRGWIETQKAGTMIDPSKPSNFIYKPGQNLTLIDLGLSNAQMDISILVHEQLAVILNSKTYNSCYPEIQEAVSKRLNIIIEKYKNALKEQGIIMDDNSLKKEVTTLLTIKVQREQIEETPEQEMKRLEQKLAEHLIKEEKAKDEAKKLQEERAEKTRIEKEKREAEQRRLDEEEEKQNGWKRNESKMYATLYGLLKKGIFPENQANLFNQVFKTKRNIYADLNPKLFAKQGTIFDLSSAIPSIENNRITVDIRSMELKDNGDISYQTYGHIREIVEDYFKQYFERISQEVETKIIEYSRMEEMHESGQLTEEQYINFRLLEAELNELSFARQFSSVLGLDEQVLENADRVSSFLQDKNKITEEEKTKYESRKKESDRDYLMAVFEGAGITDPEELRKLYYSQDEVKVTEEDLEAILANFTDSDNISPSQIGEATARKGRGITDINKTTQEMRKSLGKNLDKANELSK